MKQNSKKQGMNKPSLIASVSESYGLSKSDSTRSLEAMIQSIHSGLKNGNDIKIAGFGIFRVVKRAATTGRNPRTGEPLKIKSLKLPRFRAGKTLKEAIA